MQINIKLDENFSEQFEQLRADYGPELARLNGFAEEQLNYTDFIDNFIDKDTVADATIDANANVGTKDVCSLLSEMNKPHSKLLAFNKIYHDMAKLWGDDAAHQWLIYEWDGHYYLHDASTSTLKGYCFAFDIKPLVEKGLYFVGNFNAQPPKHLVTFTDFVGEFVSYTSNRSSGACGLPSFLVYSFYFWTSRRSQTSPFSISRIIRSCSADSSSRTVPSLSTIWMISSNTRRRSCAWSARYASRICSLSRC